MSETIAAIAAGLLALGALVGLVRVTEWIDESIDEDDDWDEEGYYTKGETR